VLGGLCWRGRTSRAACRPPPPLRQPTLLSPLPQARPIDKGVLAEKLGRLIDDPALRLQVGRAARKACEENLNIERQLLQIVPEVDRDASGPRPLLSGLGSLFAFRSGSASSLLAPAPSALIKVTMKE
jgi:hypothetical protein